MYKKLLGFLFFLLSVTTYATPIQIVAAENFYGSVAREIGGEYVSVIDIMSNPNQDPHLFSSNPSTAKAIATADLVVYNGIGYDSWMENLLKANSKQPRQIIVADLVGKKSGDNPHIWYNPATMPIYAKKLVEILSQLDPTHTEYYQQQLAKFNQQSLAFSDHTSHFKQQYQGTTIIATEPIFNDMADALGLTMYGKDFQLSIMNETEPSARSMLDFQNKLTTHLVKALIYNRQVSNPVAERMKELAKKSGIAIIGVSETQPPDQDYWTWMNHGIMELEREISP